MLSYQTRPGGKDESQTVPGFSPLSGAGFSIGHWGNSPKIPVVVKGIEVVDVRKGLEISEINKKDHIERNDQMYQPL